MNTTTRLLPADPEGIKAAAALLQAGDLVAFPTETVYGLGADARNDAAVAGIYAAKGRPSFNPLIVHLPDLEAATALADLSPTALRLAKAFWPGPLTLVARTRPDSGLSPLCFAGLPTVALRVPAAPVARSLLRAFGGPLAAPSANLSGQVSPTTAAHVMTGLSSRIAAVLDGGPCTVGLESTIVDGTDGPVILRHGGISAEALAEVHGAPLPQAVTPTAPDRPNAPGQLSSHYAPRAALRLNAERPHENEVLLAFGDAKGAMNLSPAGDLNEAAANLFAYLIALDEGGVEAIAVSPIPETGLGKAINDRLQRAAAPRD
ncbi:threonylcarbamoyl-AMP synthase [Alphaproteobacteria bacterium KMM 3653]|uniref:Threonylcarbamoyl-AMP synthase n=1 Tax=Harenicola maris TaxID=2841044 RepID=A0AAP2CP61_9RHOB|nr:threonylcarbamoyl-AMP synthase [Harenicola maris]